MEQTNIASDLKTTRMELEQKIADLQSKALALDIIEGKVSIVDEVKRRILDVCPEIQNIDYILWPIRVSISRKIEPDKRRVASHKRIADWSEPEMTQMLIDGRHDELVAKFGVTLASIRSRANKTGFAFRLNKPLKPAKTTDDGKGENHGI